MMDVNGSVMKKDDMYSVLYHGVSKSVSKGQNRKPSAREDRGQRIDG